jgi:hypothetical protein
MFLIMRCIYLPYWDFFVVIPFGTKNVIIYVYIFEIVIFAAVILPNFCCDLTRIFLDYFWQNLVGFLLQNHVCR